MGLKLTGVFDHALIFSSIYFSYKKRFFFGSFLFGIAMLLNPSYHLAYVLNVILQMDWKDKTIYKRGSFNII